MKKYSPKNRIFLFAGLFLLVITSCGTPPAIPTTQQAGNSVVISTFTAAPTVASIPQELTPIQESTPDSKAIGKLLGLSPVNVTVGLEQLQFTCTAVKKAIMYYERTCIRGLPSDSFFQVVIYGRESFIVDFIETSIKQNKPADNKIAAEILGFIANLPYQGSTPADAKAWVEGTIPTLNGQPDSPQEKDFGGVNFVLYGTPAAFTLEMGELPQ